MKMINMVHDKFVCMDDISRMPEELNYVIYNPLVDSLHERIDKLYNRIKERFGVELTSEQLIHLTKYDVTELNKFASELRDIIFN